jgi:putative oxidoreductase
MMRKLLRRQNDLGLLVLRGAALLLLVVYGWRKFLALFLVIGSGRLSSWGFAGQIAKVGFPASVLLAIFVALCESVGALFIALGLCTRVSAFLLAVSMSGALYFSLRMGEASWHFAGLYCLSFLVLGLTGPGKFSIDYLLQRRRSKSLAMEIPAPSDLASR